MKWILRKVIQISRRSNDSKSDVVLLAVAGLARLCIKPETMSKEYLMGKRVCMDLFISVAWWWGDWFNDLIESKVRLVNS